MAQPLDPYRTLGLSPGASQDEIRRAYRRLAKANHPDSAGEAALPRFLAIQAAYELLESSNAGHPGAAHRSATRPRPGQAWDADPERARATREAYGRRRSGAGTSASEETASSSASSSTSDSTKPGSGTTGPAPADDAETKTRRRRPGRSRKKATLGSTSYDAAEDEPFEPDWSGGTWYGASSGTYWTINPKEYADPRKHGPEYQRRARRVIDGVEHDPAGDEASFAGEDLGERDSESATAAPGHPGFDGRWTYPDEDGPAAQASTDRARASTPPPPPPPAEAGPRPSLSESADRLLRGDVGTTGRIGLAFLGWVPFGMATAWIAGEMTGCGRFTANCVDPGGVWTALVQFALIALMVLLPSLAAISAAGTLVAFTVSMAAALVLSAGGGSNQLEASTAILTAVMAVGYVAGAAFAAGRRLGWRRVP
jgi:curved DNA-binding protein CbpA